MELVISRLDERYLQRNTFNNCKNILLDFYETGVLITCSLRNLASVDQKEIIFNLPPSVKVY